MELYKLLKRAQKGDKEAISNISIKFDLAIKKFSRKLNYEEAETDLKIALLECINKIELDKFNLKNDGAIVNYIYFFLRNKTTKLFKKRVLKNIKTVPLNLEIFIDGSYGNIDDVVSKMFINDLLTNLTPLQQKVIKKKYIQGFTDKEIAQLLGISRQAVNRAKHRGLKKLRKIL